MIEIVTIKKKIRIDWKDVLSLLKDNLDIKIDESVSVKSFKKEKYGDNEYGLSQPDYLIIEVNQKEQKELISKD